MEALFKKIMVNIDLERLLGSTNGDSDKISKRDVIQIYKNQDIKKSFLHRNPNLLTAINIYCQRVDKILQVTKMSYGDESEEASLFLRWRGFTYHEYYQLFNSSIEEDDFVDHPVFNQLNRPDGIDTQAERNFYLHKFKEYNERSYIQALREAEMENLLLFFSKHIRANINIKSVDEHVHVTGKTRSGKSYFLRLLFYELQKRTQKKKNKSMILIDPHGDLSKKIKYSNLNSDHSRLIYFSPTFKKDFTPVINPLQLEDKSLIGKTTEFLVEAFDLILGDQDLSGQMRTILTPCVYTLLNRKGSNLNDLQRFMMNDPDLISLGRNSEVKPHRDFFKNKFVGHNGKDSYAITKNAIYNRIQNLLNSPEFYNMTMGENTIDLKKAMNSGKIILFDLTGLGGITKSAYGRFLLAKIKAIASDRERIPEERRMRTYLFIDECQNFISNSIETTLSEMGKYGLSLILAHQYISQLKELEKAVLSNTDLKVVFANDDSTLSKFVSNLGVKNLVELKKRWRRYECYIKSGDYKTVKFKPSPKLLKKKKYSLTQEQEKELDNYLLEKYYRKSNVMYEVEEQQVALVNEKIPTFTSEPSRKIKIGIDEAEFYR